MKRSSLGHLAVASMVLECFVAMVQAQGLTADQINEMKKLKFTRTEIEQAKADEAWREAAIQKLVKEMQEEQATRAWMEAAIKDWEAKQQPKPPSSSQPPAAARLPMHVSSPDNMTQEEYAIINKAEDDERAGKGNVPCKNIVKEVRTIYAGKHEDYSPSLYRMTMPQMDPTAENPEPGHHIILGISDLIPIDKTRSTFVRNVAIRTAPMITLKMAASPEKCEHMKRVIEGLKGHGSVACSSPDDGNGNCVISYWNLAGYQTTHSLTDINRKLF